jgi:hypothetical protein
MSLNHLSGLSKVASAKPTVTNTLKSSPQLKTAKCLVPFKIRGITLSTDTFEDPVPSITILNHLRDTRATLWPANKLLQLKTWLWLKYEISVITLSYSKQSVPSLTDQTFNVV